MTTLYKFTVIEWAYDEKTANFTIIFAVSSPLLETFKFIVVNAPYTFEKPKQFIEYVKVQVVLQFNEFMRVSEIQQALSNLTFTAMVEQNNIIE